MNRTHRRLLLLVSLAGVALPAYLGYGMKRNNLRSLFNVGETAAVPSHALHSTASAERTEGEMDPGGRQPIRSDLFSAPPPPAMPLPAPAPKLPPVPIPVALAASDPLSDYVYNAWVSSNGESAALIEHRKSKQGWYVMAGDTWLNYRILSVTDQQIKILVDGQERILTKSDVINLVPLKSGAGQGGRIASAEDQTGISDVLIRAESAVRLENYLASVELTSQGGLSAAEITKIKDDAFEGRITGEEAERRLSQSRTTELLLLDISDGIALTGGIHRPDNIYW